MTSLQSIPIIYNFSGFDPTGGAGILADFEAIRCENAWCFSIPTCLTAQNTHRFSKLMPTATEILKLQIQDLMAESPPQAIKIGMLANNEQIKLIIDFIDNQLNNSIPVILDPIIKATAPSNINKKSIHNYTALQKNRLLPKTTCITPNYQEALTLSQTNSEAEAVDFLFQQGCSNILLTDAPPSEPEDQKVNEHTVTHKLYNNKSLTPALEVSYKRLPGSYHGSGCTLAAILTARLALGDNLISACDYTLEKTYFYLTNAIDLGGKQYYPNRQS